MIAYGKKIAQAAVRKVCFMQEMVFVLGCPASGKSTLAQPLVDQGYHHANRDKAGGKVADLIPGVINAMKMGKSVVLDNLFTTAGDRAPFLTEARKAGVTARCLWLDTSIEDAQINALRRMWKSYRKIFWTQADLKGIKSPNMFPVSVLFKYRKDFQAPTTAEGFEKIEKKKFVRLPWESEYKHKAIILDADGTVRESTGEKVYPLKPQEVKALPKRKEILAKYLKDGYLILGASNQSAIAKGELTLETAKACFDRTNELLGMSIDWVFCPHRIPPLGCYCRKPGSGMGIYLIETYKINPILSVFVGDMTSDATFAKRLGLQFSLAKDFFCLKIL